MVSSSLEAGPVVALAVHTDVHLELGPQSPGPGSADMGLVGRRRCDRRGACGLLRELKVAAAVDLGATFFSLIMSMLFPLLLLLAANSADATGLLAVNTLLFDSVLARRLAFLQNKDHPSSAAEVIQTSRNSRHITSEHIPHKHTCTHPSMHVTSITITHTHVCNTISDTVPALT